MLTGRVFFVLTILISLYHIEVIAAPSPHDPPHSTKPEHSTGHLEVQLLDGILALQNALYNLFLHPIVLTDLGDHHLHEDFAKELDKITIKHANKKFLGDKKDEVGKVFALYKSQLPLKNDEMHKVEKMIKVQFITLLVKSLHRLVFEGVVNFSTNEKHNEKFEDVQKIQKEIDDSSDLISIHLYGKLSEEEKKVWKKIEATQLPNYDYIRRLEETMYGSRKLQDQILDTVIQKSSDLLKYLPSLESLQKWVPVNLFGDEPSKKYNEPSKKHNESSPFKQLLALQHVVASAISLAPLSYTFDAPPEFIVKTCLPESCKASEVPATHTMIKKSTISEYENERKKSNRNFDLDKYLQNSADDLIASKKRLYNDAYNKFKTDLPNVLDDKEIIEEPAYMLVFHMKFAQEALWTVHQTFEKYKTEKLEHSEEEFKLAEGMDESLETLRRSIEDHMNFFMEKHGVEWTELKMRDVAVKLAGKAKHHEEHKQEKKSSNTNPESSFDNPEFFYHL